MKSRGSWRNAAALRPPAASRFANTLVHFALQAAKTKGKPQRQTAAVVDTSSLKQIPDFPMPTLLASATSCARLLDSFPLIRSRSAEEACQRVGDVFSPHRLELRGDAHGLDVRHNRVTLGQSAINVLHYGAEVVIDPGERGDFYLVQLPLSGRAQVRCGDDEVDVDDAVLSVLRPRVASRMRWSRDCTMLLLQAPSRLVHGYVGEDELPRAWLCRAAARSPRWPPGARPCWT
jgi:hypothetical protein